MSVLRVLFPRVLRRFPYQRAIRITLRTLHILSASILLGGHLFNQPLDALYVWLYAAMTSGVLLLLTDLYASLTILFELRGMVAVLKIGLLLMVPFFWSQRVAILVLILIIAVVSSHMTGRLRHRRIVFSSCSSIDYKKY